jgi:hypothetical protein
MDLTLGELRFCLRELVALRDAATEVQQSAEAIVAACAQRRRAEHGESFAREEFDGRARRRREG